MINFYSFVYINKKRKQNKPIFSHVSAGRLKQGPFSKSCLPAPFVPTQASYTKALKKKKSFLEYFSQGMWYWTKPWWLSLPCTANLIFLMENIPDRLLFQVSRDFKIHANSDALHYLFKIDKVNEKKQLQKLKFPIIKSSL